MFSGILQAIKIRMDGIRTKRKCPVAGEARITMGARVLLRNRYMKGRGNFLNIEWISQGGCAKCTHHGKQL